MGNAGFKMLLRVADFEQGAMPPKEFTLVVDRLEIGNIKVNNVPLKASYDRHLRLYFSHELEAKFFTFIANDSEIKIIDHTFREPISLIPTSVSSNSDTQTLVRMMPRVQPMLIDLKEEAYTVEAILVNWPNLFFKGREHSFEAGDVKITIREFESASDMRNQANSLKFETIATGSLVLQKKDGTSISAKDALNRINNFARFFTFVRGGYCGLGNVLGAAENGELVFSYLGFTKIDPFSISTGWCDIEIIGFLPEIYEKYQQAIADKQNTFALLRAIEFYRASNIARESSLEMALVASHAALETLVPHVLSIQGGWSDALIKNTRRFHDKLRAAANFIRLDSDLLEHSPEVRKRAKKEGNMDAFELLSKFRNRIVHADKNFNVTGQELMEIWQFSQWLCEIIIFYLMNYREKMYDRRRYTGFRGPAKCVPLPKGL